MSYVTRVELKIVNYYIIPIKGIVVNVVMNLDNGSLGNISTW